MSSNLAKRVLVAAVGIPVAVVLVYLGGWPLVVLLAVTGVLGVGELARFAEVQGTRLLRGPALALAAMVAPLVYLTIVSPQVRSAVLLWWPYGTAAILIGVLTCAVVTRAPDSRPMAGVSLTLFAVLYAAVLPAFLIDLRHRTAGTSSWAGTVLVLFPLVATWVCDSFAMFGGMWLKGPKLAPVVSPGKTRSGGISGVIGALLVAAVFGLWIFPVAGVSGSVGALLVVGFVIGTLGQVGDLTESLFKRDAGLKDSGTLIPGHGGILDRFDSLYFVLPLTALLYRLLGIAA